MRPFRALVAALLALAVVAGCGGAPGAVDPYDVTRQAMAAKWDRVQVDLGINVKDSKATVKLDPGAIRFVMDEKAGKALVHVAIPLSALGSDAASLRALGITGDSIDFDAVYDGIALYAKSPVLAGMLVGMLAQSGQLPSGDLTGWLRLGTKDDFGALGGSLGVPVPGAGGSETAGPSIDAATLKKDLESSGVTLTYAGSENRNGVDAHHVKATIDVTKLSNSSTFGQLGQTRLDQLAALAKAGSATADVWMDKGSHRVVEMDLHFTGRDQDTGSGDIVIVLKEPAAGTSFDAPGTYTDFPVKDLLGGFMQLFGSQLGGG